MKFLGYFLSIAFSSFQMAYGIINSELILKEMHSQSTTKKIHIHDHKENIFFRDDDHVLGKLDAQWAFVSLTKNQILKNKSIKEFDVDDLHLKLGDDDLITVGISSAILPNVSPEYFNVANTISQDYLDVFFNYDSQIPIDYKTVETVMSFGAMGYSKIINGITHFQEYSEHHKYRTDKLYHGVLLSSETADRYANLYQTNLPLKMILTTFSNGDEVSEGSHGARTINLFYEIKDHERKMIHTLQRSIKIVTLKKEADYNWVLWKIIKNTIESSQRDGSGECLQRLRAFLSG